MHIKGVLKGNEKVFVDQFAHYYGIGLDEYVGTRGEDHFQVESLGSEIDVALGQGRASLRGGGEGANDLAKTLQSIMERLEHIAAKLINDPKQERSNEPPCKAPDRKPNSKEEAGIDDENWSQVERKKRSGPSKVQEVMKTIRAICRNEKECLVQLREIGEVMRRFEKAPWNNKSMNNDTKQGKSWAQVVQQPKKAPRNTAARLS